MNTIKIKIPNDIKKFVLKMVLKRIAFCVFLLVGIAVILNRWGNVIFPVDKDSIRIVIYAIVMTVPFLSTGVPFKLIDSTWEGEIVEAKIIEKNEFTNELRPRMYGSNNIILKVKTQNNKIKKVTLQISTFATNPNLQFQAIGDVAQMVETYSVGNIIFHLYGTNKYVILPKISDKSINCIVCGAENNKTEKKCKSCGLSLVKNTPVQKSKK